MSSKKLRKNEPSFEQQTLKNFVGANYTKEEAKYIWERVIDHKWYMGERLKRDIGLRVAAVDYVENFYNASIFRKSNHQNQKGFFNRVSRSVAQMLRYYFVAKSITLPNL